MVFGRRDDMPCHSTRPHTLTAKPVSMGVIHAACFIQLYPFLSKATQHKLNRKKVDMTKELKNNKKSEARVNIERMSTELKRLHDKRSKLQEGAYKRSNDELYAILQDCHTFLVQLRGEVKLRKKLNDAIEAAGYKVRSNTSIELKVVRAVFSVENNRIYAYTKVLQLAKAEMPKDWTLPEWIEEYGGIEEVRRKPKAGITAADKAKKYRELAEQHLANAEHIGKRFKPDDSLQPDDSGDYEYSVALVRVDSDGKASLVFGTNKAALVKAVVTEAGKQVSERKQKQATDSKHSIKRRQRDAVLNGEAEEVEHLEAA